MMELRIEAHSTPGIVTFDNYDEVKRALQIYIHDKYETVDYSSSGMKAAEQDFDELKKLKKAVKDKQKELEAYYSAPYKEVDSKLDELVAIIEPYFKNAKDYIDTNERTEKQKSIMEYAQKKAEGLGDVGERIVNSPAFFNDSWLLKKYTVKKYQDEIDGIFEQATKDVNTIQTSGGDNTAVLMARYYETLSMDGVKSFVEALENGTDQVETIETESKNNVLGYKILKITATEDQMASILDQLEIMGVEVEEIEDGMPKPMKELTEPGFDSFVAFDIETTGTNGAASGDSEAKITEIGAVKVKDGVVVDKFDQLANPGRKITPMVSRITHITDDMVKDMPPVDDVIKAFYDFVGDNVLVGHNIKSSDLRYITKAADLAGVHFEVPFLDTYILAKKYKDQMKWEKANLPYLAKFYGFEHKEAHRAWSDAEVNAQVYFELKKLTQ